MQEKALEIMQDEYSGVINRLQGIGHGKYDRLVIEPETVDGGPLLDPIDEQFETGYLIGRSIAEELAEEASVETKHEVCVKQAYNDWYVDINETRILEDEELYRGTVAQLRKNEAGWEIPYTSNTFGKNSETALKGVARYCRKLDESQVEDLV